MKAIDVVSMVKISKRHEMFFNGTSENSIKVVKGLKREKREVKVRYKRYGHR